MACNEFNWMAGKILAKNDDGVKDPENPIKIFNEICEPALKSKEEKESRNFAWNLLTNLVQQNEDNQQILDSVVKLFQEILDDFIAADEVNISELRPFLDCYKILPKVDQEDQMQSKLNQVFYKLIAIAQEENAAQNVFNILALVESVLTSKQIVMAKVKEILEDKRLSTTTKINLLCSLAEVIFSQGQLEESWLVVIRFGVVDSDSLTRKKSLYLLKRTVDVNLKVKGQKKVWNDFFLILEVIEEKQVHIVKQITSRLLNLIHLAEKGDFGLSWVLVVFHLLFRHQNTAVAKWSVFHFFKVFPKVTDAKERSVLVDFVSTTLLQALNNSKYYQKQSEDQQNLAEHLTQFLAKQNETHQSDSDTFWDKFIVSMLNMSWGPIPLFFVTKAVFDSIPQESHLSKSVICQMEKFILQAMHCQEPLLKCGAQCYFIYVIFKCSKASDIGSNALEGAKFLSGFYGHKKVLIFGTKMWTLAKNWLGQSFIISKEELIDIWKKLDTDSVLPFSLLLALNVQDQNELIESEVFNYLMKEIEESLGRPYNCENVIKCLRCILTLNEMFSIPKKRKGKDYLVYGAHFEDNQICLLKQRSYLAEPIVAVLHQLELDEYEKTIELIFNMNFDDHNVVFELTRNALETIIESKLPIDTQMKNLVIITNALSCDNKTVTDLVIGKFSSEQDLSKLLPLSANVNRDNRQTFGKVLALKWEITSKLAKKCLKIENIDEFLSLALDAIISSYGPSLANILDGIASVLDNCDLDNAIFADKFSEVLMEGLNGCFDLRKNEHFWPSIQSFIELCFMKKLLWKDNSYQIQTKVLTELINESESVCGIATILARHFNSLKLKQLPFCLRSSIGKLISYGPLYRKDQRLVMEVNEFVQSLGYELPANLIEGSDHTADTQVRANVLCLISNLEDKSEVISQLFEYDTMFTDGKTRYFDNSVLHLSKNRIYQTIVLFTPEMNLESSELVVKKMLTCVMEESIQNSLRYYGIWAVIRAVLAHPKLESLIQDAFKYAKTNRLSTVPSFLQMLTHIALNSLDNQVKLSVMDQLMPWCMAQHFTTRTCAQVCFKKIVQNTNHQCEHHLHFLKCIDLCVEQGDKEKNVAKMKEDFFLNDFDPFDNQNVKDIFVEFPRLCGVLEHEWNSFDVYQDLESEFHSSIEMSNKKSNLHLRETPKVKTQAIFDSEGDQNSIIQKKITPWTSMFSSQTTRKVAYPNLIVVASLIDRLPNLGGLCRTCEIFGVGQYVISTLKYTDEKEFQNVSVTAQNWVPMTEVPQSEIGHFLDNKRSQEGYTIVAIEQTSQSEKMGSFVFPEKCILLLGNEKEGIPVDLIAKVDVCVEIPQEGVIRSLNVHVTGALVIWEYVRQQRVKKEL